MSHIGKKEITVSLNMPIHTENQLDISENAMINYCAEDNIPFEDTFTFKHGLRSLMIREFTNKQ
jgi:hypothetical protein